MSEQEFLRSLSPAQLSAATHAADEPLQILAGPGSGKTRVLVSRVAWLVAVCQIDPKDIVVVTFTNKAAREMRHRLIRLIGQEKTNSLVLGTFHALCAKYLRRYASLIGIGNNFSICDSDETKRIIKGILKATPAAESLRSTGLESLRPEVCMSEISRAKAAGKDPDDYVAALSAVEEQANLRGRRPQSTAIRQAVAAVYRQYAEHLRINNALDFDDLLVQGVLLLRQHARVIANLRHVLVDEFQDTNCIQYELMAIMAGRGGSRGAVSIVGDPDQSIYGWRSAEVGNLEKMAEEFAAWSASKEVKRSFLEENYRSTGSVLDAARGIISSSSSRIERGLFTSHVAGPPTVLCRFTSSQSEAMFIATEIQRLKAMTGSLINYSDIAILLRYNALSREVEQQLLRENVPSKLMGGARFFDRKEVKDLLAYLLLADNPRFSPAFNRVVNVPKRAIGDKSIKDIQTIADTQGRPVMELVKEIANSTDGLSGIKTGLRKSLRSFFDIVEQITEMSKTDVQVADIIRRVIELTGYEAHLRREPDFDQRWENVQELISFSTLVASEEASEITEVAALTQNSSATNRVSHGTSQGDVIDLCNDDEDPQVKQELQTSQAELDKQTRPSSATALEEETDQGKTPLRLFLEACTLSTDLEGNVDDDPDAPKVTIATAHAAKGLEFPIVFVLSVEEGTYPFYRSSDTSEEVDEEARLLYVAATRAQTQLYMTYCASRLVRGEEMPKVLSRFVSRLADASVFPDGKWTGGKTVSPAVVAGEGEQSRSKPESTEKVDFSFKRPTLSGAECKDIASVLGRQMPAAVDMEASVRSYQQSGRPAQIRIIDGWIHRQHAKSRSDEPSTERKPSLFADREVDTLEKRSGSFQPSSSLISRINASSNTLSSRFTSGSQFGNGSFSSFGFGGQGGGAPAARPLLAGQSFGSRTFAPRPPSSSTYTPTLSHGVVPRQPASHTPSTGKRLGMGRPPSTFPKKPKHG